KMEEKIMFEKIQEMMVESLSLEKDDITLDSTFKSLEIDSLDVFELVTELEEEFDIEIEDAENLKSVQDLVTYIEEKVAAK
ncbi:acyl carrier protein, partial [Intestinibacter sp.]|uniref:acyl carrier protein n=1 Tax=Intestinibacter sp. TaxID=1965304 RepID=UPI003F16722E